jgi:hypothetical protein
LSDGGDQDLGMRRGFRAAYEMKATKSSCHGNGALQKTR